MITATVAMLLVTLVAAAAFVVIAQRRQRQLGLLAAAGATERDVRLVMIADGAGVGIVAAVAGVARRLRRVDRRRFRRSRRPPPAASDLLDIPWWVVVAGAALAVTAAVAAAWWPARTIARLPIMSALSGRPPRPRRCTTLRPLPHCVLLAGGVVCLDVRTRSVEGHRQRSPRPRRRDRDDVRPRADRATRPSG